MALRDGLPRNVSTGSQVHRRPTMFAWGGLIVFAATGRPPFGTGTSAELLDRVRAGDCDLTGVPEGLMELVARALSTDPEARPTAVEAFHAVLALDTTAADAATEPGEDTAATHRERLRALLYRVWTGFDAAGTALNCGRRSGQRQAGRASPPVGLRPSPPKER